MKSITKSNFLIFYLPLILFFCAMVFASFKRFPDLRSYGNILFSIGTIFGTSFFLTLLTKYRWGKLTLINLYGSYFFISLGIILGFQTKEFPLGKYLAIGMIVISLFVMGIRISKSKQKLKSFIIVFGTATVTASFVYGIRVLAKYLKDSGLI